MTVLWNGAKDHPGGRQLFVDEWPVMPIPIDRRSHPICAREYCIRHVEQRSDTYCRICENPRKAVA